MDHRPRLLLVDDDADMRTALAEALAERFVVEPAANAEEGLRRLREGERPCAVLLDLLMPEMDGGEFLNRMREEPEYADVPVVILTGIALWILPFQPSTAQGASSTTRGRASTAGWTSEEPRGIQFTHPTQGPLS